MHFSFITSLSLLLTTAAVSASPILERRQTIDPPARYYLETTVVNGDHEDFGSNKSSLWLYSHHTGAGLGDAGLSSNRSWAMEGYLNDTQQLFTFENNQIGPWPLAVGYGPYQRMYLVLHLFCKNGTLTIWLQNGTSSPSASPPSLHMGKDSSSTHLVCSSTGALVAG